MISRNQARLLRSLSLPKYRKIHRQFIAEGTKLAGEMLHSRYRISMIFALGPWLTRHESIIQERRIDCQEINEQELKRISQMVTPNDVVMVVDMPDDEQDDIPVSDLILFLDRIQDPGNMGTILRTADWFGIHNIVCSPGCADIYNPKVVQASMGSITRVKVSERESGVFLGHAAENSHVYGAMADGENIYQTELKSPAIVIIGNESQGISSELLPYLHHKVAIPKYAGTAESLNAAIAASIILSEFKRRLA